MSDVIIENCRIIDGTGAAPFIGSVLIENSVITGVGDLATSSLIKPGLKRINAKGNTVMPGLIDTHCHLSFDDAGSNSEIFFQRRNGLSALVASYNARKLLRAGVTGVLDPDSTFENMLDLRDAIDANIVEGPRMSCGSYALITGVGGTAGKLINDEGITGYYMAVNSRDEIVREVRRQIKNGTDWIKVHVTGIIPRQSHKGELCVWTMDELKLICDTAHELETPVMGHCRALTFQYNMVEFGGKIGTSPSLMKIFEREITDSVVTMKEAHKAGVPLLTGSESGFSLVPYGDWHYREMEVFVKFFGMSPLEAIQCATEKSAFGIKMAGKTGAIKIGYRGDIICVKGRVDDNLALLGEPSNITNVLIDGVERDLSEPKSRRNIAGWRLASIGDTRLTREVAYGAERPNVSVNVEELH